MTARVCLEDGCPRITTNGSRCAEHTKRKPSPSARGYDSRWHQLSAAAIKAQPWCSQCGSPHDLTADHIVPLARGGLSVAENVRVLCRACNGGKRDR